MTLKTLLILVVLVVGGWYVFSTYYDEPMPTAADVKPDTYTQAEAWRGAGRFDDAVTQYQKFLAENPGDPRVPDAAYNLARSLDLGKRHSEAKAAYQQFLKDHPDHALAKTAKGRIEKYTLENIN